MTEDYCKPCANSGIVVLTLPRWNDGAPPERLGKRETLCACVKGRKKATKAAYSQLRETLDILRLWVEETIWKHYDVLEVWRRGGRDITNDRRVIRGQLRVAQLLGLHIPKEVVPDVRVITQEEIRGSRPMEMMNPPTSLRGL